MYWLYIASTYGAARAKMSSATAMAFSTAAAFTAWSKQHFVNKMISSESMFSHIYPAFMSWTCIFSHHNHICYTSKNSTWKCLMCWYTYHPSCIDCLQSLIVGFGNAVTDLFTVGDNLSDGCRSNFLDCGQDSANTGTVRNIWNTLQYWILVKYFIQFWIKLHNENVK